MNEPMRKAEGFPTRKWPRSTLCLKRSMVNGTIPFTPQIPEMNQILYFRTDPKTISQKEYPSSQCSNRRDQNIPLGQLKMAFQAALDRLHGFFAQRNALLIDLAAQLHDQMDAFPRHTL